METSRLCEIGGLREMMSKGEQLERIKKTEAKAKKMLRENDAAKRDEVGAIIYGADLPHDPAKIDELLNNVIKWELLYEKRYGRDPMFN